MAELNSHIRFPRYVQFRAPEKLPKVIGQRLEDTQSCPMGRLMPSRCGYF